MQSCPLLSAAFRWPSAAPLPTRLICPAVPLQQQTMRHAALVVAVLAAVSASISAARTVASNVGAHRRAMLGTPQGPNTWEVSWGPAYGE